MSISASALLSAAKAAVDLAHLRDPIPSLPKTPDGPVQGPLQNVPKEFWDKLDNGLFALIHGDRDISDTSLEGNHLKNTSRFLIDYLKISDPNGFPKSVFSSLEKLASPNPDLAAITKEIYELKSGEIYLLGGGWVGNPGHAMVYQFKRTVSGNYEIYIYNTGSGISNFHSIVAVDGKQKSHPIVFYKDVPPEKLCFPSTDFILRLVALRQPLEKDEKEERRSEKIYRGVFGMLDEHIAQIPNDPVGPITPQRSGTCSMRVLFPLMNYLFGDKRKYKIWKFWFKFNTLLGFKQNKRLDQTGIILALNAAKNLLLSAAKLRETDLISRDEAERVENSCSGIIAELEKEAARLPPAINIGSYSPQRIQCAPVYKSDLATLQSKLVQETERKGKFRSFNEIDLSSYPTPDKLWSFLSSILKELDDRKQSDPFGTAVLIEKIAFILPLDNAYWDKVSYPDIVISQLTTLAENYAQLILNPIAKLPEQMNASMSFVVFVHQLALRLDYKQKNLKQYGIDTSLFENAGYSPACIYFRQKDFKRRQDLLAYFKAIPQEKRLFEYLEDRSLKSTTYLPEVELLDSYGVRRHPKFSYELERLKSNLRLVNKDPLVSKALVYKDFTSFVTEDTSHLYSLFRCAFVSRMVCGQSNPRKINGTSAIFIVVHRDYQDENTLMIRPFYGDELQQYSENTSYCPILGLHMIGRIFTGSHRGRDLEDMKALLDTNQFHRTKTLIAKEGNQLIDFKKTGRLAYDVLASCIQCEPELQLEKVIQYYIENLSLLENPDLQTVFDLIFFKMIDQKGKEYHLLFNEMMNKGSKILDLCDRMIALGLTHYSQRRPGKQPQVFPALFFVRLALRISSLSPEGASARTEWMLDVLNHWIENGNLSLEEKAAIHLHRAYALTLSPMDRWTQLCESWLIAVNEPHHPHWMEIDLLASVRAYIYDNQAAFRKTYNGNQEALNRILPLFELKDKNESPLNWKGSFPVFEASLPGQKESWELNLLTGEIGTQNGLLRSGEEHDFTANPKYVRLFGDTRYQIRKIGSFIQFRHPRYGLVRIRTALVDTKQNKELAPLEIQVRLDGSEGSWWQYIAPNDLNDRYYSLPIIADHDHWISADRNNPVLRIYSRTTGQLTFIVNPSEGILRPKNSPLAPARLLAPLDITESNNQYELTSNLPVALSRFERPNCMLVEGRQEGLAIELNQVILPRYISRNGEPLRFYADQYKMHWSENSAFCLVADVSLDKIVPNVPNGIVLANSQGDLKALVPIEGFKKNKEFDRGTQLDVYDEGRALNPIPECLDPQNGSKSYIEYDIVDGDLVALSDEGRIFLSYLYLAQKRYLDARELFIRRPKSESLSTQTKKILNSILFAGNLKVDKSPSAAAVALRAALILAEDFLTPRESPEPVEKDAQNSLDSLVVRYHKALEKIPEALRLNKSEWKLLRSAFRIQSPSPNTMILGKAARTDFFFTLEGPLSWVYDSTIDVGEHENWKRNDQQEAFKKTNLNPYFEKQNLATAMISELFGPFYHLARTAKSPSEKTAIAHRLELIRSFNPKIERFAGKLINDEEFFALLHFALRYPDEAPPIIPNWNLEQFKAFIQGIRKKRNEKKTVPLSTDTKREWSSQYQVAPVTGKLREIVKKVHETDRPNGASPQWDQIKFPKIDPSPLRLSQLGGKLIAASANGHQNAAAPKLDSKTVIREDENTFSKAVESEFKDFISDFNSGVAANKEQITYTLSEYTQLYSMQKDLVQLISTQSERVRQWTLYILALANKIDDKSPEIAQKKRLLEQGGYLKRLELEECINLFCRRDPVRFAAANPHLTPDDISTLMQLIQVYLVDACELSQAERALQLLKRALQLLNRATTKKDRPEELAPLIHQLGVELHAKPFYDPALDPQMLVFEYRAKIRMRKNQIELIQKICKLDPGSNQFRDVIIQLMMGGGKTQVISSVVLMIVADGKNVPIFTAPAAQYESLKRNLGLTQKHNFEQTLRSIDVSRSDFTLQNLNWILEQLQEAIQLGDPVLMKSEKVQGLQLEFLSLIDTYAKNPDENKLKLEKLQQILKILSKQAVALWDEVDLLMNPNVETNFPAGSGKRLEPLHVDLMRTLFEIFVSDQIKVDGRSMKQWLQLENNLSSALPIADFRAKIAPAAADALVRSYEDLRVPPGHGASFVRFVTGQMKKEKLSDSDKEFLKFVENLHKSTDEDERNAADLICLAKHFLSDILPLTLQKSVGRHFGRARAQELCKVVPYLGVDAPAPTEFGDQWEAAAYHFMTSAARGISQEHIDKLATMLHTAAEHFCRKDPNLIFDTTPEAEEFLALTGIPLSKIRHEGNLETAKQNIDKDIKKKLALEAEIVCELVNYYPQYLSSNPQDFAAQFPMGRRTGLTGTPFNYPAYPKPLSENVVRDDGVDGRIVEQMLNRSAQAPAIYSVPSASVKEVLSGFKSLKGQDPTKLRGIIDSSGIFRDYDNETIAKELLKELDANPQITTILFFGRKKKSDILPDHLMAIQKGMEKPFFIGSTRKEELAKLGIFPEQCFTFYDERHCEATDIAQVPDAVNIMTIDEKVYLRKLSQGALRLRGYFLRQNVVFAKVKHSEAQLVRGGKTVEDVILTALKNQAIVIARDTFRSYKHRIRGAARQAIVNVLLDTEVAKLPEHFRQFREILITTRADHPFDQYFELESQMDPIAALQNTKKRWLALMNSKSQDARLLKKIEEEMDAVLKDAANASFLPSQVPQPQSDTEDLQIEVEMQREVEVEMTYELEIELQKELQRYQTLGGHYLPASEFDWRDEMVPNILKPSYEVKTLSKAMRDAFPAYEKPYDALFSNQIYATHNWLYTTGQIVPIFHPHHKPVEQILVLVDQGVVSVLLLSIHDAVFFKDYLARKKPNHMWLMFANGTQISANPPPEREVLEKLGPLLIQLNVLRGNARYLDNHEKETREYLTPFNRELVSRFLRLRVEHNSSQKTVYYRSDVLNPGQSGKILGNLYRRQIEKVESALASGSPAQIGALKADLVPKIKKGDLIKYLKTPEQIQRLTEHQVPFVVEAQLVHLLDYQIKYLDPKSSKNLINKLVAKQLEYLESSQVQVLEQANVQRLSASQIKEIAINQVQWLLSEQLAHLPDVLISGIKKEQVPHLHNSKFQLLVNVEQIQAIPVGSIPYPGITFAQIQQFSDEQMAVAADLVPDHEIPNLKNEYVKYLKLEAKIQRLVPSQLSSISAEQVKSLSNAQIQQLTAPELIQKVPLNKVALLDSRQVPAISADQVPSALDEQLRYLETVAQIRAVPEQRVHLLVPKQILSLSDSQAPWVSDEQVPYLVGSQVKQIAVPERIKKIALNELKYLLDSQLEHLSDAQIASILDDSTIQRVPQQIVEKLNDRQVPMVSVQQVPMLLPAQLKWLRDEAQIQEVGIDHIPSLVQAQYPHLSAAHIYHVPEANVAWLNGEQVKHLGDQPAKVQNVKTADLPYLEPAQLAYLTELQVKELAGVQIQQLEQEQIKKLSDRQITHVLPGQVGAVNDPQLRYLTTADQVEQVANERLQYLVQAQYRHLSDAQIAHIPSERVDWIRDDQIRLIEGKERIQKISKDRVKHITENQLVELSDEQIPGIDPKLVEHLADDKIKFLETADQVLAVSQDRVTLLSEAQLSKAFTQEQIQAVAPERVKFLAEHQVEHLLTKEQLDQVPEELDEHLTGDQIRLKYGGKLKAIGYLALSIFSLIARFFTLIFFYATIKSNFADSIDKVVARGMHRGAVAWWILTLPNRRKDLAIA